jgi:hypothetical protein
VEQSPEGEGVLGQGFGNRVSAGDFGQLPPVDSVFDGFGRRTLGSRRPKASA